MIAHFALINKKFIFFGRKYGTIKEHFIGQRSSCARKGIRKNMKKKRRITSFVTIVLAVLMVCGCIGVPVGAVSLDDEEERGEDILWELDFSKMKDILDNGDSQQYTLTANGAVAFHEMDSQKCLGIRQTNGAYFIEDTNNILKTFDVYYIEADMYFESFPTGAIEKDNPRSYPMSFMTWITAAEGGNPQYGSIRVDDEGYLCTAAQEGKRLSDTAKLPLGEWFNIRFIINPKGRQCEVYINHESVGSYGLSMVQLANIATSRVRFFDTRYIYSVLFKNISVTSDSDYRIGTVKERSADYLAYQTSKIENGKFDLRMISGLDTLNYRETGFTVYRMYEKNGSLVATEEEIRSSKVYESLNQKNADGSTTTVKASDFGVSYLSAIDIKDIETTYPETLIVIRPWTILGGNKKYGTPKKIIYTGNNENGYPIFGEGSAVSEYTLSACDDTYVGGKFQAASDTSIHGAEQIFDVKNDGSYTSNYTRQGYVKFKITDKVRAALASAESVSLEFFCKTANPTVEEGKAGGVLAILSAVDTKWTEEDLTKELAASTAAVIQKIGEMRYASSARYGIDITEYIKEHIQDDEIAFRIENVNLDKTRECTFYTKEYGDGENAPRLVIRPTDLTLNYEIDFGKLNNHGYEPWGYAEKLVDEWFNGDKAKLYEKTYDALGVGAVENNSANGDYSVYNPLIRVNDHNYVRLLSTLSGFKATEKTLYDEFGGILNSGIKGKETGFFHAEKINGKTYIIDPIGNPFYAMGVNTVTMGATKQQTAVALEKYESEEIFFTSMASEFRNNFGLNSVFGSNATGYSILMDEGIACVASFRGINGYMATMGLSISTGGSSEFLYNDTMNVFDPDFLDYVDSSAKATAEKYVNEKGLLGYTSDNEIPGGDDILKRYLTIDCREPVNAFSYATAWTWFCRATEKVNPSLDDITSELSQEFLAFVYNNYFRTISSAIRKYDPNHMYIGTRSHTPTKDKEGYLRALGQYADLMTVNMYGRQNYTEINRVIEAMHKYTGLPFIVTEFGVRAKESVDMNGHTLGNYTDTACWLVQTQQQRANSYESYVLNLLESNNCVGWILYRFRDNDQSIYIDGQGNQYLLSSSPKAPELMYTNIQTGEVVSGNKVTMEKIYFGETDSSNLSHNKGIYDNHMEPYTEMMTSMKRISDNLLDLIRFFEK